MGRTNGLASKKFLLLPQKELKHKTESRYYGWKEIPFAGGLLVANGFRLFDQGKKPRAETNPFSAALTLFVLIRADALSTHSILSHFSAGLGSVATFESSRELKTRELLLSNE